tara:strand:- start:38 stop:634 length:597 start_codon:yes stop_codon:yes gene_type:complete
VQIQSKPTLYLSKAGHAVIDKVKGDFFDVCRNDTYDVRSKAAIVFFAAHNLAAIIQMDVNAAFSIIGEKFKRFYSELNEVESRDMEHAMVTGSNWLLIEGQKEVIVDDSLCHEDALACGRVFLDTLKSQMRKAEWDENTGDAVMAGLVAMSAIRLAQNIGVSNETAYLAVRHYMCENGVNCSENARKKAATLIQSLDA